MPLPLVRLVTPATANTESVKAFKNELENLGWVLQGGGQTLDFNLASAQVAVNDAQGALAANTKVVIVTAGLAATSAVVQILQAASTTTIPVFQAAGGWLPTPLPAYVTGFVLNPLDPSDPFHLFGTSEEQLKKLVSK